MQKGHARIDITLDHLRELPPAELESKLHSIMPSHVFRLITFAEDNYEKQAVTIFCFNFIPPVFFVVVSRDQDIEIALQQVAALNPGLVWEKAEVTHARKEDEDNSRITQELKIISVPPREDVNDVGEKIRLTQMDIQYIHKTLRRFEFQMGATGMFANNNPLNPSFFSRKGLVFIYGNEHFGTIHINERHGWFTDGSEWRKEPSGRVFLDNPSKFAMSSIPIEDYTRIADEIYTLENRNPNNNEDVLEKYTGVSNYAGEEAVTFHLLVYKETKIVHTLFPQSKKLNRIKRNVLDYKKGKLTVDHKIFYDILIATLPYYNTEFTTRYVIIIKLDNNTGCRQIWIETTTMNGNPMYCKKVQETFNNPPMDGEKFFKGLEFADFSNMEKWIKQFDNWLSKQK